MRTKVNYQNLIEQIRKNAEDAVFWLTQMKESRDIEEKYQFLNDAMIPASGGRVLGQLEEIEKKLYAEMRERKKEMK